MRHIIILVLHLLTSNNFVLQVTSITHSFIILSKHYHYQFLDYFQNLNKTNTPRIFTLKYEPFKNSNSPCYLILPGPLPTEANNFLLISLLLKLLPYMLMRTVNMTTDI